MCTYYAHSEPSRRRRTMKEKHEKDCLDLPARMVALHSAPRTRLFIGTHVGYYRASQVEVGVWLREPYSRSWAECYLHRRLLTQGFLFALFFAWTLSVQIDQSARVKLAHWYPIKKFFIILLSAVVAFSESTRCNIRFWVPSYLANGLDRWSGRPLMQSDWAIVTLHASSCRSPF